MTRHSKYTLDPSSKKYECPNCKKKTFVLLLDLEKNPVDKLVYGRCDREDSCGYFKTPDTRQEFNSTVEYQDSHKQETKLKYQFSAREVNETFQNQQHNNLFKYICTKFTPEQVMHTFDIYRVGVYPGLTNYDWTLFWQIDGNAWVRTAKIIKYTPEGRRDKSTTPSWYHTLEKHREEDHEPQQCLFGYHLKGLGRPIAVVESEKTALICSLFIPNYTWMATGGKSNFRLLKDLRYSDVTLFPDLGAYDKWVEVADKYKCKVSDYLERIATEEDRVNGYDLADFLMR